MSATTGSLNRSAWQAFTILRLSIFADRNRWSSRFVISLSPLLAAELAEAYSFARAGTVRKGTACRA
jgi:hypothetical protein